MTMMMFVYGSIRPGPGGGAPRARGGKRHLLWVLAAAGLLSAVTLGSVGLSYVDGLPRQYSFLLVLVVCSCVLPRRLLLLSPVPALLLVGVLARISDLKVDLVGLPLTFFDVQQTIADPLVPLNALGFHPSGVSILGVGILAVGMVVAVTSWRWRARRRLPTPNATGFPWARAAVTQLRSVTPNVAGVALVLVIGMGSLSRYGAYVEATLDTGRPELSRDLWLPDSQVALARELGVLGYWGFIHAGSRTLIGEIGTVEAGRSIPEEDIRRVAGTFVDLTQAAGRPLPNIVMLHAESTFDPNRTFELSAPVELALWSGIEQTQALGPLHVNVKGGGSWVTEFEVLVGIDSRRFGYLGFYTNYLVTPHIRTSLVRHLADRGYVTKAFYPAAGSFYNSAQAFRDYGFSEFLDAEALGLSDNWAGLVDREIIEEVLRRDLRAAQAPFFYFVSTSENHGPHPCRHYGSPADLTVTFSRPASFEANCQLNEYIRRARSTSAGFELLVQRLRAIEADTGRPWVVMAYGDHQPWSFTSGAYSVPGGTSIEEGMLDLSAHRRGENEYETFFHLASSEDGVVTGRFPTVPPAWIIPTLVGAYAARSPEDLYLPVNLYLYAE